MLCIERKFKLFILTYFKSLPPAMVQGIIWGIMAIGVYITYKVLDMADLTVDGSIVTGMAVCAVLTTKTDLPVWVAIIAAMAAGMLTGLITGIFHTILGIPAILSGILTQLMLWSINLKIMAGTSNITYPYGKEYFISTDKLGLTAIFLLIIVAVIVAVFYWFFGTNLGSAVRATGCNENMSRAQGINTSMIKLFGFMLSNSIVALSGALLSFYLGSANINTGRGAIVIGLAAVIIGESLFGKIAKHNFALRLLSVVAGGVVYYIVYQTVIYIGVDPELLKMLSAIVVAVFLAVPYLKKTYFSKPKKKAKETV